MNSWIRLAEKDHVIVALKEISKGETLLLEKNEELIVVDDVPEGHKIVTCPIRKGEDVLKFGYSIGIAKEDLIAGSWVHTHNLETGLKGFLEYTYESVALQHSVNAQSEQMFQGFVRRNGDVGIRNEIWIINTVGCINKTCETIAKRADSLHGSRIDGVYHFAHPFGCSQLGDDLKHTQKLLASLVNHPNAAGVLVVGLGCENNQIDSFKQAIGAYDPSRVKFMKSQEVEDELEIGLELVEELVENAAQHVREPVPVSKLKIGLKCGGSDGLSGVTANPLVGSVSDRLIEAGGTAILTEVPELFGAETILMSRAADEQVFDGIVALINNFKQYFIRHNQEIYENPSPGNKAGGISTLEEKSLGCTQKGGQAIVTDVIAYGERVTKAGLNLLEAPGNDLVSVTALSASGAHIVLFTTGRGTPFGGPVPTVKIATNNGLAERKKNWIDFNAGQLLGNKSMNELTDEIWTQILSIASGESQTKNEKNGFREIAIFKDGVIM
ncbi:altronate hydrolase [Paenibacillus baekrokdamisoli]|uniref:Altronate hydrolase n=1 Tax=Paenibacillus baekrokdamisoli TaxID=1712516 RepID=A0A3G9J967_9BACL|nr:altronate dehydratase family protein [Paenibacillus baekrokdamisoli]MBB3070422.1 altronate hydrolase [Paenibacillus baekrokdamisoli]BBH21423.1 altronate hydrolase [Paenibacillus baekrokdamisoli]